MKKSLIVLSLFVSSVAFGAVTEKKISDVELDSGKLKVTYLLDSNLKHYSDLDEPYLELQNYCDNFLAKEEKKAKGLSNRKFFDSSLDIIFIRDGLSRAMCVLTANK
jgi:hypothetical protein